MVEELTGERITHTRTDGFGTEVFALSLKAMATAFSALITAKPGSAEHEVVTAEGGQAGIDTFTAETRAGTKFDAVITDLGMPYVDGRKVATRIRQLGGQIPIIMLTGWGHRMVVTNDKPEQVDRVLSKPPKMSELRSTLSELVRREDR